MPLHTALVHKCEISCDGTVVALGGHSLRFSVRPKVAPNLLLFYWVTVAHRKRVLEGEGGKAKLPLRLGRKNWGVLCCSTVLVRTGPTHPGEKRSERKADYLSPYNAIIMCELYILFPIWFHGAVPNTWLTLSSSYIVREINENRYVQTSKTRRGKGKCMQNSGRKIAMEQAIFETWAQFRTGLYRLKSPVPMTYYYEILVWWKQSVFWW